MSKDISGEMIAVGVITIVVAVVTVALVAIPAVLWHAFVFTKLWTWFVVPLGGPALTLRSAIGVTVIAGMLAKQYQPARTDTKWYEGPLYVFGAPAFALLIGWLAH